MFDDLFERSDSNRPAPKSFAEALSRFFGGVLSDALTMILVTCLGGLAVAGILAWQFGLSFVMALGALALLVCGYYVMTLVSKIL